MRLIKDIKPNGSALSHGSPSWVLGSPSPRRMVPTPAGATTGAGAPTAPKPARSWCGRLPLLPPAARTLASSPIAPAKETCTARPAMASASPCGARIERWRAISWSTSPWPALFLPHSRWQESRFTPPSLVTHRTPLSIVWTVAICCHPQVVQPLGVGFQSM